MKIEAAPMKVPSHVSESLLKKTPAGVAVIKLLKEGIKDGCIQQKSVEKYLEKWDEWAKPGGTCFGQASAIMIADKKDSKGHAKKLVARAEAADVVAFQILNNLKVALNISLINNSVVTKDKVFSKDKNMQKIADKARKLMENNKKSKKELKEIRKVFDKSEEDKKAAAKLKKLSKKESKDNEKEGTIGSQILPSDKVKDSRAFRKKVISVSRTLLEELGGYKLVEAKRYPASDSKQLKKKLEELHNDKSHQYAVRFAYEQKAAVGHAICLFPNSHLAVYDSNFGMLATEKMKKLIEDVVEKRPAKYRFNLAAYDVEIYKRT